MRGQVDYLVCSSIRRLMPPRRTLINPSAVTGFSFEYGVVSTISCIIRTSSSNRNTQYLIKRTYPNVPCFVQVIVKFLESFSRPRVVSNLNKLDSKLNPVKVKEHSVERQEAHLYHTKIWHCLESTRSVEDSILGIVGWAAGLVDDNE